MTITLPDEWRGRIESLAKRNGYASLVDYVLYLLEEAETDALIDDRPGRPELRPKSRAELEQMLLDGLNSGPSIVATPEFWEERRRELERRMANRNNPAS